ncbi:MAG TPA: Holliday junction branch migration protein RuvA [Verrucomicrobiales bacterium]|jgi:Holliday junction DNA helicase RuvA|nr:Holliday junction branch migration protein RuvA [Verrucomicrobiales bacterium]
MIARIRGKVLEALPGRLVIDVNGLGYLLTVSLSTYDEINPVEGKEVDLHAHLHIRETAHTLYGFASVSEKDLFLLLIERVTGIGPAIGMAVLSGMPVDHFKSCVVNGDAAALSQIKGLGKKTAERIILELKDKVGVAEAWQAAAGESVPSAAVDAESALIGLGYKQVEARKAVAAIAKIKVDAPTEDLLREALRMLNS